MILIVIGFGVLFPAAVFQGEAIAPGELQFFYEPWHSEFSPDPDTFKNWILFDEILEFYPWREFMSHELTNGRVPLWDPTAFCGYPFQGLYQTALLYPPDRLIDFLPYNTYSLFRTLFHLLIAGTGIGLYLRTKKFHTLSITCGMVAFAFCGFCMVWLGHPHLKVAVWLPWLFWGISLLAQHPRKGTRILIFSISMTLLGGHIETALHTLSAALLYLLLQTRTSQILKTLKHLYLFAIAGCFAILLAGAMWLPFIEYLAHSVAYNTRADGVVTQGWLDPILSLAITLPEIFGNNASANYWYQGFNTAEVAGAFTGIIIFVFSLLSLCSLNKNRLIRNHFAVTLTAGLTAYGIPPVYQLITWLPGYRMSYNFRLTLPMAFGLIVMATFFIEQIFTAKQKILQKKMIVCSLGSFAIFSLGVSFISYRYSQLITVNVWYELVKMMLLGVTGILLIPWLSSRFNRRFGYLLPVLILIELLQFSYGFNTTSPMKQLEQLPISAPLLVADSQSQPFRTLPTGKTYPPHSALRFGMHDVRGNDALTPLVTENYLSLVEPEMRAPGMLPALRLLWLNKWRSPLINALNIKYICFPVTTLKQVPTGLKPKSTSGGIHIFENPDVFERIRLVDNIVYCRDEDEVLEKLPATDLETTALVSNSDAVLETDSELLSGQTEITSYSAHFINADVTVNKQSLVVLSDTFFPGWKVFVDGIESKILQTNHMMRGVIVDKGSHNISFSFEPSSFRLGLFLTLVACFLIPIFWNPVRRKN